MILFVGCATFHEKVEKGDMDGVSNLLEEGVSPDQSDEQGRTPLIIASIKGHAKIVKLLLEKGANVHARHHGFTPLHYAAREGHSEAVRILINAGAQVDALDSDENGWTPLYLAAWNAQDPVVSILIKEGAKVQRKIHSYDLSLFGSAFRRLTGQKNFNDHHRNTIALLLQGGANANEIMNEYNETALFEAVRKNDLELVEMLVDHGAKINLVNSDYYYSPLILSMQHKDNKIAKYLIQKGASIQPHKKDGWTALHEAVSRDNVEMVRLLVQKGLEIHTIYYDPENRMKHAPVEAAVVYRSLDSLRYLIEQGANVNWSYNSFSYRDQETSLHYAARDDYPELAKILIDAGVDIQKRRSDGLTPLEVAEKYRSKKTASLLREALGKD